MSLYCDKENVNVLTALMKRFGVRHVVVCPGSRNGVLVHNFAVDGSFVCHPVTDERSAAFVALGLCAATHGPTAVCVTSGSALLNTLPAVAEAYYRHLPLLVVSADRPPQWIGQQDGQTLPQDGALRGFTHKSVSLPEPYDAETQWWLRRLANEALSALSDGPVHVNIPVSEPLFTFTTPVLPDVQPVRRHAEPVLCALPDGVLARWQAARCPVLVVGQVDADLSDVDLRALSDSRSLLVLPEFIAQMPGAWRVQVLETLGAEQFFTPDLVFHVGGTLVGKGLKRLLRRVGAPVIRMGRDAELTDTFEHLSDVVPLAAADALWLLARTAPMVPEKAAVCRAQARLAAYRHRADAYASNRFSDLFVMQSALREVGHGDVLHLANSNSIRNAGYFLDDPAYHVLALLSGAGCLRHRRRYLCRRASTCLAGRGAVRSGAPICGHPVLLVALLPRSLQPAPACGLRPDYRGHVPHDSAQLNRWPLHAGLIAVNFRQKNVVKFFRLFSRCFFDKLSANS